MFSDSLFKNNYLFLFSFVKKPRTHGAQFLIPVVCYPMFKPYEIHDERERLEVDHKLYLQSPESRTSSSFSLNLFFKMNFFRIK